ncbi:MAG TPA: zinc ribbon domain-containing protein [Candidatus Brocadiia bacterium]|nr:zinc ribbon domain-containing protein [Candidatus Brocadiia bacterium]
MPTYEYECSKCGHRFEKFQSIKDAPLKKCPECKANKLQRLIGIGAGVIFKGSGFYETDYKRKSGSSGGSSAPKSDSKAKTDSGGGASAGKDAKPSKD